jgi:hypothetical protein
MDNSPSLPRLHRSLMATRSGWQSPKDVAHAYMLRGAILTAVSHLELCIAELSLRASYVPVYGAAAARRASLPPNTTQRVKFLMEVIEDDGPLRPHAEWLRRALKRWEVFRELRNRMAHGHMTVFRGRADQISGNHGQAPRDHRRHRQLLRRRAGSVSAEHRSLQSSVSAHLVPRTRIGFPTDN